MGESRFGFDASIKPYVDIKAVNDAARHRLSDLLADWLPGGRREGREYVVRNPLRADGRPGSFKINISTGAWSDFATDDRGSDPTSLYAFLKGLDQMEAARAVADHIGIGTAAGGEAKSDNRASGSAAADWRPIVPAPADAPKILDSFVRRLAPAGLTLAKGYFYESSDGQRMGHIARYEGTVDGKMTKSFLPFTWCAGPDGKSEWRAKGFPEPRPLYGLKLLAQRPSHPVIVTEGEKSAESAYRLFPTYISVTSPCGSKSARKTDWSPLAGRDVVIWPDADAPGAKYAADVSGLAQAAGATSVRIVQLPPGLPDGWDVADDLPDGITLADLQQALEATKAEPNADAPEHQPSRARPLPPGFRMLDRGLVWSDPSDNEKPEIVVSGCFEILAESRDEAGWNWGALLRWRDPDGRSREWAMPRSVLAADGADVRRALLDGGLYVGAGTKARNLLTMFLTAVHVDERARAVSSTGWHGASFVLPDGAIGEANGERVILQTTGALDHAYNVRGDLKSWQDNVARYGVANSRLVLAISTAFAAALVGPCGGESGGIHFRGKSSIGKSTALMVAGSVWGGGDRGFVRQWRATSNGLEAAATSHNDALLCLDELAQLSGREAGEVAYMLANGSGKARASRDATLRKAGRWRLLFLSSGEIGLADKIAEDMRGRRQTAGQQVRVVDVPADTGSAFGLFENIHSFPDAGTFAKHLVAASKQHYGTAARAFIERLAPELDKACISVMDSVRDFIIENCAAGADGQVTRVAGRFGLIASAGEIATALGILPWEPGEALLAAKVCFNAWIEARGGTEPAEVRDGIAAVRAFISAHGSSRFLAAWDDDKADDTRIVNLAGYRRKVRDGDGGAWEYFVTAEAWGEVTAGFDPKALASILAERGLLLVPVNEPKRAKLMRVPGHAPRRLYHLAANLMGGEDD